MSERAAKIYADGLSITARTNQFGEEELRVWVRPEFVAFVRAHADARGTINVVIRRRREAVPGKPTHYAVLDTYQPGQAPRHVQPPQAGTYAAEQREPLSTYRPPIHESDIPF